MMYAEVGRQAGRQAGRKASSYKKLH